MKYVSVSRAFDILADHAHDDHLTAKYLLVAMLDTAGIKTEDELRKYFTMKVLEGSVSREGARATIDTIVNNGWLK